MRRRPKNFVYSPDVLKAIEGLSDPEERARACVKHDLIADDPRTQTILASCASKNSFYQELALHRLSIREYPSKKRKLPKKKQWVPPNRSLNLFPELVASKVVDQPNLGHGLNVASIAQSAEERETTWAGRVASATQSGLIDGLRTVPLEEYEALSELVMSMTPEEKREATERYKLLPTSLSIEPLGNANLFRNFGVVMPAPENIPILKWSEPPARQPRSRRAGILRDEPHNLFEVLKKDSDNE